MGGGGRGGWTAALGANVSAEVFEEAIPGVQGTSAVPASGDVGVGGERRVLASLNSRASKSAESSRRCSSLSTRWRAASSSLSARTASSRFVIHWRSEHRSICWETGVASLRLGGDESCVAILSASVSCRSRDETLFFSLFGITR